MSALPDDLMELIPAPTSEQLRAHVYQLAHWMNVPIYEEGVTAWVYNVPPGEMQGVYANRFQDGKLIDEGVFLTHDPGSSIRAYGVALHELGHVATYDVDPIRREEKAWQWARENTLIPLDEEDIEASLASHRPRSLMARLRASMRRGWSQLVAGERDGPSLGRSTSVERPPALGQEGDDVRSPRLPRSASIERRRK